MSGIQELLKQNKKLREDNARLKSELEEVEDRFHAYVSYGVLEKQECLHCGKLFWPDAWVYACSIECFNERMKKVKLNLI